MNLADLTRESAGNAWFPGQSASTRPTPQPRPRVRERPRAVWIVLAILILLGGAWLMGAGLVFTVRLLWHH
jgi:hypothetical protein